MNRIKSNKPIDRMIENILETRFENFDSATVKHAKNRIIDTLGCLIGGAKDPSNPQLLDLIKKWGGSQESTILVYGNKVPAHNAAMMNSIMARSFDFEPVSPLVEGINVPGHISGSTIPTAIALGELTRISGKDLLTALLVGDDISARISVVGSGMSTFSGRDRVGPINAFGTTAIAGRLLGLTHLQLRNALGLLLAYCGGSHQMILDTTTGFKLSQGTSARDGIISAQMAEAGWTGVQDSLLSDFGYFNLSGQGRDKKMLTAGLGEKYYSDSTFKPYPCCRLNHSAIDSTLALVGKIKFGIEDTKEIIIQVAPPVLKDILGQPFKVGDFPHASAIFSLQYTVADALLRKSVKPEHFTEDAIRDPGIKAVIKKMTMQELKEGHGESARIRIITIEGKEYTEFTDIAKGDPLNPLTKEELIDKFWTNVEFSKALPEKKAEKTLAIIQDLEKLDDVSELVSALTAN
ncbi:MAG: MmgE/PrpD family protein [Dehalococcoidales bacterium]|nr:MmgE/PrpD family protein [Dehalococcoidales bacterium]